MPVVKEDQLSRWTSPPFANEDQKAANTERMIREAIQGHGFLSTLPIDVYAKGSYKNNTTVRQDSDVDVAVEYTGMIHCAYGPDTSQEEVRRVRQSSAYSGPFSGSGGGMSRFKAAIQEALEGAFGAGSVERSNKVFTVREGSRSLAADVVPCTTYRKYWSPQRFNEGIWLLPDRSPGHDIYNYPQQHYDAGVKKNNDTGRSYKRVVRILKQLENRMVDDNACPAVPSYLIESLCFNCPNALFTQSGSWGERVQYVLAHMWSYLKEPEPDSGRWHEANGLKFLFHEHQKWTRDDAMTFVVAAFGYVGDR